MKNKYLRAAHLIFSLDDSGKRIKPAKDYKTINKAKKESRSIQIKNDGSLGRGSVITA